MGPRQCVLIVVVLIVEDVRKIKQNRLSIHRFPDFTTPLGTGHVYMCERRWWVEVSMG